jgi:16S rRNA (guanine(966)-N(2))-methyltransferase RsmD
MGIEALSQGAKEVVFVEKDRQSLKSIGDNLRNLGIPVVWGSGKEAKTGQPPQGNTSLTRLIPADALAAISGLAQEGALFDMVFADPPYYQGLAEKTLQKLVEYDILLPLGYIILQHFKKDAVPESCGKLVLFKQAKYGDTVLSFYTAEADTGAKPISAGC